MSEKDDKKSEGAEPQAAQVTSLFKIEGTWTGMNIRGGNFAGFEKILDIGEGARLSEVEIRESTFTGVENFAHVRQGGSVQGAELIGVDVLTRADRDALLSHIGQMLSILESARETSGVTATRSDLQQLQHELLTPTPDPSKFKELAEKALIGLSGIAAEAASDVLKEQITHYGNLLVEVLTK